MSTISWSAVRDTVLAVAIMTARARSWSAFDTRASPMDGIIKYVESVDKDYKYHCVLKENALADVQHYRY